MRYGASGQERTDGWLASLYEHGGVHVLLWLLLLPLLRLMGCWLRSRVGSVTWVPASGWYAADDRVEQVDLLGPLEA